jgi:hypothetical protein
VFVSFRAAASKNPASFFPRKETFAQSGAVLPLSQKGRGSKVRVLIERALRAIQDSAFAAQRVGVGEGVGIGEATGNVGESDEGE